MDRSQKLKALINKYNLNFPTSYFEFLSCDDPNWEIEIDYAYWTLATVLESDWEGQAPLTLDSDFSLDRLDPVPFIHALKMFLKTAEEFLENDIIQNENGKNFTTDRLANSIAIGEENGDILFIDQETQAVYAFYHDGYYVSQVANSFSELMAKSEQSTDD